jgi:hypothetical protein
MLTVALAIFIRESFTVRSSQFGVRSAEFAVRSSHFLIRSTLDP